MKFTKAFTLAFALLLLGMSSAKAGDNTDMTGLIQKNFEKAYTGMENTTIINYRPKDCDFQVNQQSNHTSIFDKTNRTVVDETATTPQ